MPAHLNLGGSFESEVGRSYNSMSGTDIRAVIGNRQFSEIQAISYSVSREKAPIYTMGSPDVRAFSRNKRGVAGSLVWINFDRHALLNLVYQQGGLFVANVDDIRPEFRRAANQILDQTAIFESSIVRDNGLPVDAVTGQLDVVLNSVSGFKERAFAWYSDQVLPFDITLAGTNEIGAATTMKIFGVEILNEGGGISVDDAVTEMQATFVAKLVEPWSSVQTAFPDIAGR